jgi:hypothetical protein
LIDATGRTSRFAILTSRAGCDRRWSAMTSPSEAGVPPESGGTPLTVAGADRACGDYWAASQTPSLLHQPEQQMAQFVSPGVQGPSHVAPVSPQPLGQ